MRKYVIKIIMAVFAFIAVLPLQTFAAEPKEEIAIVDEGNGTASVKLTLPKAAQEKIATLQLSLIVEPKSVSGVTVEFVAGDQVKNRAKIYEYRYNQETKVLNIYLSGTEPLFADEENTLEIGRISVNTEEKEKVSFTIGANPENNSYFASVVRESEIDYIELAYPENKIVIPVAGTEETQTPTPDTEREEQKEALKYQLELASGYEEDKYTALSYMALKNAMEQAEKVLNDPNATTEEIGTALQELQDTMGRLEFKEASSAEKKYEQDQKVQKTETAQAAETGDRNLVWLYAAILVVSVAVIAVFVFNKLKKK